MKNIFKLGLIALMTAFSMASCDPQESDDHSLGATDTVTADQLTYTQVASEKSDNIVTFTCTTELSHPFSVLWDLGNGTTSKSKVVTGEYPMAGDYTVTLTVYTADGNTVSKSTVLHLENSDFGLIDTPAYRNLTGGIENTAGKVWVLDQYNNYVDEVAKATGKAVKGHMGLDALNSYGQTWWGAASNEKADKWTLYDYKFTFIQDGAKLKLQNGGEGYGRNKCIGLGGFSATSVDGEDATFTFTGGDYSFSIDETKKYPVLKLSGNAFMGYYCGTQEYDIFYQTDKVMALCAHNTVESQDWVFVYCLEELNVSTPPIVKAPEVHPLKDDFEQTSLNWVAETMGGKSGVADNPFPVPVNESDKVYRYQKSSEFYSNLSFTASTYTFDLTKQNKIRFKVFIPSYNDYTTAADVAGDWITINKLQKQVAVKLQNSAEGGNAWSSQTDIVKANLTTDKWIELEFDFSSVKDRKDYDKIVIQFGAEGHAAPGIFFFDDFSFGE